MIGMSTRYGANRRMGTWYEFVCESCDYAAEVSGGADTGMLVSVLTMTCLDCEQLVDVITRVHDPHVSADSVGRCPECKGRNLEPWVPAGVSGREQPARPAGGPQPGRCPRCGSTMGHGSLMALWD